MFAAKWTETTKEEEEEKKHTSFTALDVLIAVIQSFDWYVCACAFGMGLSWLVLTEA